MTDTIYSFKGEYDFLSNFYPATVEFEGDTYRTTEHAFQAAKTLCPTERAEIRAEVNPGKAKTIGRKVTLRPDWEDIKESIMLEINRKKFSDPELARKLVDTGNAELIEGNWWGDKYWGVCDGIGLNRLGNILMKIREELNASYIPDINQENAAMPEDSRFTEAVLDEIFSYQRPEPEDLPKFTAIRDAAKEFAKVLVANTPASPDQTVAIRKIREVVMTANASIALKGKY